jgi:hypothetical protein
MPAAAAAAAAAAARADALLLAEENGDVGAEDGCIKPCKRASCTWSRDSCSESDCVSGLDMTIESESISKSPFAFSQHTQQEEEYEWPTMVWVVLEAQLAVKQEGRQQVSLVYGTEMRDQTVGAVGLVEERDSAQVIAAE